MANKQNKTWVVHLLASDGAYQIAMVKANSIIEDATYIVFFDSYNNSPILRLLLFAIILNKMSNNAKFEFVSPTVVEPKTQTNPLSFANKYSSFLH